MTKEQILKLLPKKSKCIGVNINEFETETDCSTMSCKDACSIYDRNKVIDDCADALVGKVVAKKRLLTANDIVQVMVHEHNRNNPNNKIEHTYNEVCSCCKCHIAGLIIEAQQKKAGVV